MTKTAPTRNPPHYQMILSAPEDSADPEAYVYVAGALKSDKITNEPNEEQKYYSKGSLAR